MTGATILPTRPPRSEKYIHKGYHSSQPYLMFIYSDLEHIYNFAKKKKKRDAPAQRSASPDIADIISTTRARPWAVQDY